MMKSRILMMLTLTLLVSCASLLTGCVKDNIVPPEEESEEVVKTAREVLSEIKGVTIIDDDKDVDGNDIIKFFFEQPVDHKNPAAGKFSQYCVLHYKGPKNITFLHTQGYSITTSENPWTGATIPDPDKDDPYVKKYVVPNGTHNAWLTYPSYYTAQDRDYIVNTVKEWLK